MRSRGLQEARVSVEEDYGRQRKMTKQQWSEQMANGHQCAPVCLICVAIVRSRGESIKLLPERVRMRL